MKSLTRGLLISTFAVFASACDPVQEVRTFINNLSPSSRPIPAEVKEEVNQAAIDSQAAQKPVTASELAKENSELLSEMMRVIFNQDEVEDKSGFGALVHSLNQGASLEGIYSGIIMGSRYRALESKSQAASPGALKAFAVEVATLQLSMKNPSVFHFGESKKAPSIEFPDGTEELPSSNEGSQVVEKKKDRAQIQEEILQMFIGASTYTLKRTLGQEVLKKMDEMKGDMGEFAQWYATFVLRMADKKIDFGLELRNKPDFDFHFKFAQKLALDRVKWEVLNRYHRYLNQIK